MFLRTIFIIICLCPLVFIDGCRNDSDHSKGSPTEIKAIEQISKAPEKTQNDTGWDYDKDEDKMGRWVSYFASTESTNTVNFPFPYAGEQHANLMLRYRSTGEGDILLSVGSGQFLCGLGGCNVLVRFDDENPINFPAFESTDHKTNVIFIGEYSNFMDRLKAAKRVRMSAEFYQSGSPVLEFDVSSFDQRKYYPDSSSKKANRSILPLPTFVTFWATQIAVKH